MLHALKPGGLLIIKSRSYNPVLFPIFELVKKEIQISSVQYADFDTSMKWLSEHIQDVRHLLGDVYDINDFETAFNVARKSESNKIFIKVN